MIIVKQIEPEMIFVFGSNLAGLHGAGAALHARKFYNAVLGQRIGLQGQSYAIPTKDENLQTLPLTEIKQYVNQFIEFAKDHPELEFFITPIGCGLAGYTRPEIQPMFASVPDNCVFASTWLDEDIN